jgi:hypothetical protein
MTNYDNILDSNSFQAMSTKELIAIGRYINTTKNGENDLVEQDFFDALIARLSDVSGDNDRLTDEVVELEGAVEDLLDGDDPMNEYARCGKREARKIRERDERRFQEFYRNCAPCAPKSNHCPF